MKKILAIALMSALFCSAESFAEDSELKTVRARALELKVPQGLDRTTGHILDASGAAFDSGKTRKC